MVLEATDFAMLLAALLSRTIAAEPAWDVVVGRRPYVTEATGALQLGPPRQLLPFPQHVFERKRRAQKVTGIDRRTYPLKRGV